MTLKQLEAFYWAANCANFAIAAQRLHLSISSLSKRIAELESALGVTLFDRSGHRAELTPVGERLLPQALVLLDQAASLRASIAQEEGLSGCCHFGVGELSALTWLPQFIAAARKRHPKLQPAPYVEVGAVLERRVDSGELDFAIVAGRSSRQGVLSQPVAQAQFAWMGSPTLLTEFGSTVAALRAGLPLIALPAGAGTTRVIDDWLLQAHLADVARIDCNNWGAIAGMLMASVGVGILPRGWQERPTGEAPLHIFPDAAPQPLIYSFQWRRGDSRPVVEAMRALVMEMVDFSSVGLLPWM